MQTLPRLRPFFQLQISPHPLRAHPLDFLPPHRASAPQGRTPAPERTRCGRYGGIKPERYGVGVRGTLQTVQGDQAREVWSRGSGDPGRGVCVCVFVRARARESLSAEGEGEESEPPTPRSLQLLLSPSFQMRSGPCSRAPACPAPTSLHLGTAREADRQATDQTFLALTPTSPPADYSRNG